jgi:hypothetical protein
VTVAIGATDTASPAHVAASALAAAAGNAHVSPSGPAFTVVLLVHVAAVLVAMIALVSATVFALRLLGVAATAGAGGSLPTGPASAGASIPDSVRNYFAPGFNWAARALFVVPVAGAGLIALSRSRDHWGDDWVLMGLVLWAVAAVVAESQIWPAERRIQRLLTPSPAGEAAGASAEGPGARADSGGAERVPAAALADARLIWRWSVAVLVVLVAATVLMVARP